MAGAEWGRSDWVTIDQDRINQFADATGDHQWIHVDLTRARQGPFGAPIAHGFLTLSLIPALSSSVVRIEGLRTAVNYGLNRVRFPAPVLVGSRIRVVMKNLQIEEIDGGLQVTDQATIEIEGHPKPACVAELISCYYF